MNGWKQFLASSHEDHQRFRPAYDIRPTDSADEPKLKRPASLRALVLLVLLTGIELVTY